VVSHERWTERAQDGIKKFAPGTALYIRPMYWPDTGMVGGGVKFDPASTRWCMCLYEAPMPEPKGISVTLSPFRRPTIECAPVDAKAGCLYPNNARAITEAGRRGFDNCLLRDFLGNIAELGNANVFMAKDGVVFTPVPNGTFLNGITRQRVISLLRGAGVEVVETTLTWNDFLGADEIFSAGNFSKVMPVIRIEQRQMQPGPKFRQARELYWAFAHGG
jgi:branched-chain amino acid aminotransferase